MPYTSTHLSIWIDYIDREKITWEDKTLFLIWTLLPDIKCWQLSRNQTHYYEDSSDFMNWNFIKNFIKEENVFDTWKNNYLLLWYLLHLLTDEWFIEQDYVYVNWTVEHNLWNIWREINAKNDFYYSPEIEIEFLNIKKYLEDNKQIKWLTDIYKWVKDLNKFIILSINDVIKYTNWKTNFIYEMLLSYEWIRNEKFSIDDNIIEFKKHFTSSYKHRNLKKKVLENFYEKNIYIK